LELLDTLKGSGWIYRTAAEKTEAHYAIRIWRTADGAVFARGHITGDAQTISGLSDRPISLVLSDGQAVSVTVVGGRPGSDSAEVYIPGAIPVAGRVIAAWPR
jgi:hypothetical protein